MANSNEITVIFGVLTTNYGYIMRDKTPEQLSGLLDIWKQTLGDLDGDLLRASALKIISTSKWFPSVAELRDAALDIAEPEKRRTGIEAWGDVVKEIHRVGSYGAPYFTDDLVAEVVKMLDWQTLCLSEEQTADRARFIAGYEAIVKRKRDNALLLPEVRRVSQLIGARRAEVQGEIKRLAEAKRDAAQ